MTTVRLPLEVARTVRDLVKYLRFALPGAGGFNLREMDVQLDAALTPKPRQPEGTYARTHLRGKDGGPFCGRDKSTNHVFTKPGARPSCFACLRKAANANWKRGVP